MNDPVSESAFKIAETRICFLAVDQDSFWFDLALISKSEFLILLVITSCFNMDDAVFNLGTCIPKEKMLSNTNAQF
jgi:hypothetical protein